MRRSIPQIAEHIQRYCTAHPEACDSIDGITWWVQMQRQEDSRSDVFDAVQWLVQQGSLERIRLQDGSDVFGCIGSKGRRSHGETAD